MDALKKNFEKDLADVNRKANNNNGEIKKLKMKIKCNDNE